jgi:valyl-tRNA synthetase
MGQRHNLELINILTDDAKINDMVESDYIGMDRFEARKQIIKDLNEQDLLEKIEPHKLMVPRGDRTNAVIEPYMTDQWFVKVAPLAQPAIDAVKNGTIRFVPENWDKTYYFKAEHNHSCHPKENNIKARDQNISWVETREFRGFFRPAQG